jgi:hypothetical protein
MTNLQVKSAGIAAGLACIMLQACGTPQPESSPQINLGSACKKYISELMGRPVALMRVDRSETSEGSVSISYVRNDDQKLFKYECKLEGDNIVWRGVDIFGPGEGPGRWREEDAKPVSSLQ